MADAGESMTGEPGGFERLLTPSKITAWLDCAHYLTLKHEVEGGGRPKPGQPFGSFAKLLMERASNTRPPSSLDMKLCRVGTAVAPSSGFGC